jgi:hypothetical protein
MQFFDEQVVMKQLPLNLSLIIFRLSKFYSHASVLKFEYWNNITYYVVYMYYIWEDVICIFSHFDFKEQYSEIQ